MATCKIVVVDDNGEPDMGGDELALFIDGEFKISWGKDQADLFRQLSPNNQILFDCLANMMEYAFEDGGDDRMKQFREFVGV